MRKILLILLLILVFTALHVNAQGWEWAKAGVGAIDEWGESVVTDAAGNAYVCGTYNSANFTFGGATLTNPGCSFSVLTACDVVYLLKCDPDGNLIWLKAAPGSGNAVSVTIDNLGNLFVAGTFYSDSITFGTTTLVNDSSITADVFLAKYDSSGNVLWAKSAGGKMNDVATAVQSDQAGNAYMTGYFQSSAITFGITTLTNDSIGTGNIFVVKYNANGNVVWAKSSGGKEEDEAAYLAIDRQSNVYVTGSFYSPSIVFGHDTLVNAGSQNMFMVKYDSSGNVIWANDPGSSDYYVNPMSISVDNFGSVYVTGYFAGLTCAFGAYTLTNSDTAYSGDLYSLFLVRYDAGGAIKWAKTAIDKDETQGASVINDAAGNVYMSGTTSSDTLVIGADTIPNSDLFLVKYDSAGNVLWTGNASGFYGGDYPACITTDGFGSLYVTGNFAGSYLNFGTTTLSDNNNYYMFLAKYNTANVLTPIVTKTTNISIFPNPATTSLTISSSEKITTISITNLLGQIVYQQTAPTNCQLLQIDVSMLPPGIYFVKVSGTEVRKFVKS